MPVRGQAQSPDQRMEVAGVSSQECFVVEPCNGDGVKQSIAKQVPQVRQVRKSRGQPSSRA